MRYFPGVWSLAMGLLCGGLIAAAPASAADVEIKAGDWPSWRGPHRDAKSAETGLLNRWTEEGPPLMWEATGLGKGYSSIAIADGRISTMGEKGGECVLLALNLDDGQVQWETPVGRGSPNCTPTVDGDLVFALGRGGDLICCKTATGEVVWQLNYGRDFQGRMMSGWGYSESPLVDGDLLICTPGADEALLAALNKRTGEVVWKSPAPRDPGSRGKNGAAYSSVVISEAAGVKQYVQLTGRGLVSVDPRNGRVLWTYNRIANGTANIPTPIVKDDYIFCSTGYNTGSALLEVRKEGGELQAHEIYFLDGKTMQNHHGGMVLVGDHIYCGHQHNQGFPICLEMKTGKIAWGGRIRGAGSGSAAVLYADGHLYFRYEDGTMALVEATPEEYRLKGSFKLNTIKGRSWPHPVISGGRMFLRDQDVLMCYDIRE